MPNDISFGVPATILNRVTRKVLVQPVTAQQAEPADELSQEAEAAFIADPAPQAAETGGDEGAAEPAETRETQSAEQEVAWSNDTTVTSLIEPAETADVAQPETQTQPLPANHPGGAQAPASWYSYALEGATTGIHSIGATTSWGAAATGDFAARTFATAWGIGSSYMPDKHYAAGVGVVSGAFGLSLALGEPKGVPEITVPLLGLGVGTVAAVSRHVFDGDNFVARAFLGIADIAGENATAAGFVMAGLTGIYGGSIYAHKVPADASWGYKAVAACVAVGAAAYGLVVHSLTAPVVAAVPLTLGTIASSLLGGSEPGADHDSAVDSDVDAGLHTRQEPPYNAENTEQPAVLTGMHEAFDVS